MRDKPPIQIRTDFEIKLERAILERVKQLKDIGTVLISFDNLLQCVRPPSQLTNGAPHNSYAYRELFREVCQRNRTISDFIL